MIISQSEFARAASVSRSRTATTRMPQLAKSESLLHRRQFPAILWLINNRRHVSPGNIMKTPHSNKLVAGDHRLKAHREDIRGSLDEIAVEVETALRHARLNFPVFLVIPNTGNAILILQSQLHSIRRTQIGLMRPQLFAGSWEKNWAGSN